MKNILDNDDADQAGEIEERTNQKAITYLSTMLVGSLIFSAFRAPRQLDMVLLSTVILVAQSLLMGLIVEGLRYIFRKARGQKRWKDPFTPFWFEVLENGFAWWILFLIIGIVGLFVGPQPFL